METNSTFFNLSNYYENSNKNNLNNNLINNNLNTKNTNNSINVNHHSNSNLDLNSLNILGLSLKFDDILILCIILFLYSEKVNDFNLFFILFLLLIT